MNILPDSDIQCRCLFRIEVDNSPTKQQLAVSQVADYGQLAETFDEKFRVNNRSKCDFQKFAVGELTSPRVGSSSNCSVSI